MDTNEINSCNSLRIAVLFFVRCVTFKEFFVCKSGILMPSYVIVCTDCVMQKAWFCLFEFSIKK